MPTKALGLIKELFNASMTNTLEDQLALESKLQIEAAQTNDYAEGVAAFIEILFLAVMCYFVIGAT